MAIPSTGPTWYSHCPGKPSALVPESLWTEEVQIMMSNRLAEIHRDLSHTPLSIVDILRVLAGRHFDVVKDPLRRKINFVLRAEYRGLIEDTYARKR